MQIISSLVDYDNYRASIVDCFTSAISIHEVTERLRNDGRLRSLRERARMELQQYYEKLGGPLGCPPIPVFLPVRKKIAVRGKAFCNAIIPREIRIYCIHGPRSIPYEKWTPLQLSCDSNVEVFETLIHECAHITEAARGQRMSHGQSFIDAYMSVETVAVQLGMAHLIRKEIRLSGVPSNSLAAFHKERT